MDYKKASSIRKTSLVRLIAQKKFEEGQGIGSSIGGAISDKFKAKATGLKETFDPLNWVRKVTGKGAFGDIATTIAGRTFGRSDKDIDYFGGYARKNKNKNKDPQFTTIGPGPVRPLKINDTSADILAKTYNFLRKTSEQKIEQDEIEKSFRQERLDEDERRHKELVEAIKKSRGKNQPTGKESKSSSLLGGLGLASIIAALSKKMEKLKNTLGRIGDAIIKRAEKFAARIIDFAIKGTSKILAMVIKGGGKLLNFAKPVIKSVLKSGSKVASKISEKLFGKAAEKALVRRLRPKVKLPGQKEIGKKIFKTAAKSVEKKMGETAVKSTVKQVVKKILAKKGLGFILKKVPLVSLGIAGKFAWDRIKEGDYRGAGYEAVSGAAAVIPGVGTAASLGADMAILARDIYNEMYKTEERPFPFEEDLMTNPSLVQKIQKDIIEELKNAMGEKTTATPVEKSDAGAGRGSSQAAAMDPRRLDNPNNVTSQVTPTSIPKSSPTIQPQPSAQVNTGGAPSVAVSNNVRNVTGNRDKIVSTTAAQLRNLDITRYQLDTQILY